MTSPFILREPSFAEQVQPGVQTLMQALSARQELGLQRQRLQLEQQRTEASVAQAGAATAESRARTKQLEQELKEFEQRSIGLGKFAELSTDPDGFTEEAVGEALASLKDPIAAAEFNKQNTLRLERERKRAELRGLRAEADVAERTVEPTVSAAESEAERAKAAAAEAQRRAELFRIGQQRAKELLLNPDMKLPEDPTLAQAVGLSALGVLSFVSDKIGFAMQQAGTNAQSAMFTRQLAVDAYRTAWQQVMEELKINPDLDADALFREALEQRATALGLPGGAEELQKIVRAAFNEFTQGFSSFGNPAVPDPGSVEIIKPIIDSPGFRSLPPADQAAVVQAAHQIAAGEAQMPTAKQLRELGVEKPERLLIFIRAAVKKLTAQRQSTRGTSGTF
jgi:hypothetical protein